MILISKSVILIALSALTGLVTAFPILVLWAFCLYKRLQALEEAIDEILEDAPEKL